MSSLDIEGLSVSRGGRLVIRDVSFSAPSGAWSGLIGLNGAGKTTLLRAIAGRLPAETGVMRVGGVALEKPEDRAGRIGLAPSPDLLPTAVTPGKLMAEVARAHGAEPRPARLAGLYAALALEEFSRERIGVLSAGQRQRLALYLAFLGDPEVVLLDEPFNTLDPLIAFDLKMALRALAQGGLAILTALHDLPTLALHCDSGLLLSHGRVAEIFDPAAMAGARRDPATFEAEVLARWRRAEAEGT